MALDLGEKRIGLAVSDETRIIARSLKILKRSSRKADYAQICRLIDEQRVGILVVGLPTLPSGSEGSKAAWIRDYASELADHTHAKIVFWDESFSTIDAESSLRERGVHGIRRRQQVDAVAAAFILQSYLDSLANS
jgi:putative Holliday junction resolvase